MAYATISNWTVTDWTDEMESVARDKFVPMIMSAGAMKTQMVRTSAHTFSVITEYADAKGAETAQTKIAEIRSQASQELPMTLASAAGGEVFAKG